MNDIIAGTRVEGQVVIDGQDIYAPGTDVVALRRRVGMVFQKSNPFPEDRSSRTSPTACGSTAWRAPARRLHERVEESLQAAAIWDEVKDRLHDSALRAVRRPAAAALHRARAGDQAGDPADGRAGVGARSDRHAADRGADLPAEDPLHDRHRHAQHAAGGARLRPHGVLLARQAGRVRPDRSDLHQPRSRS